MLVKYAAILATIATLMILPWTHAAPNGPTFEATACIDDEMDRILSENNVPGGSIAVMHQGELAYAQGYGTRDVPGIGEDLHRPFLASTPGRIFSISKTITATTLVLMAQDGLLDLDDKVFGSEGILAEYTTEENLEATVLDPRIYNITVRQTLRHTAGLAPLLDMEDPTTEPTSSTRTIADAMGIETPISCSNLISYYVTTVPLIANPGEEAAYSNVGYCVLERVIETVSGTSYEAAARQWLLDPLDIDPSQFYLATTSRLEDARPEETEQYMQGEEGVCYGPSLYPQDNGKNVSCPYGALYTAETCRALGAWIASAPQVVKLGRALSPPHCGDGPGQTKCLLEQSWRQEIEEMPSAWPEDSVFYVGLGWWIRPNHNGTSPSTWFHEGSSSGGFALFVHSQVVGYDYAIVFNGNNSTGVIDYDTAEIIVDTILGCVPENEWPLMMDLEDSSEDASSSSIKHGVLQVAVSVLGAMLWFSL